MAPATRILSPPALLQNRTLPGFVLSGIASEAGCRRSVAGMHQSVRRDRFAEQVALVEIAAQLPQLLLAGRFDALGDDLEVQRAAQGPIDATIAASSALDSSSRTKARSIFRSSVAGRRLRYSRLE